MCTQIRRVASESCILREILMVVFDLMHTCGHKRAQTERGESQVWTEGAKNGNKGRKRRNKKRQKEEKKG